MMASLQRNFQREIQEKIASKPDQKIIDSQWGLPSVISVTCDNSVVNMKLESYPESPGPGYFKRSFRHSTSEKKLKSTQSTGTASFKRRSSLSRIRQPLVSLRGSIRSKIRRSQRKSLMKGKQDYSAGNSISGLVDFCRFVSSQEDEQNRQQQADLQQKIEYEVKMHDGCAKLLAASKRPAQKLEAAKKLLASNARIHACMSELQLLKATPARKRAQDRKPCKGSISVTNIRVPLIWKDTEKDHRRYSAFCLFKIGTEVRDTALVTDLHKFDTDICLSDVITFNDVSPDFRCDVEVYSHKQDSEPGLLKTPKKIKRQFNEISNTIGRSMGRHMSGMVQGSEFDETAMVLGPKFEVVARGSLTLGEVSNGVCSHDLRLETTPGQLNLYGHFCCRMQAQPNCLSAEQHSGTLLLKSRKATEWRNYWFSLNALTLSGWKGPSEADCLPPAIAIPIDNGTQVALQAVPDEDGLHTFNILGHSGKVKYACAGENREMAEKWYNSIVQLICDHKNWQHACKKTTTTTTTTGLGIRTRSRTRLYKKEKSFSVDSPMSRMLNRLNVSN